MSRSSLFLKYLSNKQNAHLPVHPTPNGASKREVWSNNPLAISRIGISCLLERMASADQGTIEELMAFLAPDESADQLLRRSFVETRRTNLHFIDQHVELKPGHPLEVAGPSSSGKTEILLQVLKDKSIHVLDSMLHLTKIGPNLANWNTSSGQNWERLFFSFLYCSNDLV